MTPIILSGGNGQRLWPLSRRAFPKQFHRLTGNHSLFQDTLLRFSDADFSAPVIVCNESHRFIVREQMAALEKQAASVLLEPMGRDTAPAITIAALQVLASGHESEDDLILVCPADHVIADPNRFRQALEQARPAAEAGDLVLFGIQPKTAETGYGYISYRPTPPETNLPDGVFTVDHFTEKPDIDTAHAFLEAGNYLWNSGIFLFRASAFLNELERLEPALLESCRLALARSEYDLEFVRINPEVFSRCRKISVDYAVMEPTERAVVVPMDSGWSDVGAWSAVWSAGQKDPDGNVVAGDAIVRESRNCLVKSDGRLVALVGVDDLAIIDTQDALLVTHRDHCQAIKALVCELSETGRKEINQHREVYRPWGAYDSVDQGQRFQVKRITVKPGASLSLQKHHHRAEHWVVVSGTAEVTCNDAVFQLTENQSTFIPVGAVHRLANRGLIPLEIIEIQSGSYLGEDDIERLQDVYGRVAS